MSATAYLCRCCYPGCDCGCVEDCPLLSHREPREDRTHSQHDAAQADFERVVSELRDRLDETGADIKLAALDWLAQNNPDAVNDALNETGA